MKYENPFIMSKDVAPYLYLTEYSGIYLNQYGESTDRYVSIPINKDAIADNYVVSMQFWIRYPNQTFDQNLPVLDIITSSGSVNLMSTYEQGGGRAQISINTENICWQNGYVTKTPIIYPSEWQGINISFPNLLDLSNFTGEIRLYKGFVFNNIEVYSYTGDTATLLNEQGQYIMNGEQVYNQRVGTSLVSIEDRGSISVFSNGVDLFTDVVWQKFDKNVV